MANQKKNFETPTDAFISRKPEPVQDIDIDLENYKPPKGYRLIRESKSARLQLLVTPTIAENLKSAAAVEGISLNEYCNRLFEKHLKEKEG